MLGKSRGISSGIGARPELSQGQVGDELGHLAGNFAKCGCAAKSESGGGVRPGSRRGLAGG